MKPPGMLFPAKIYIALFSRKNIDCTLEPGAEDVVAGYYEAIHIFYSNVSPWKSRYRFQLSQHLNLVKAAP
jgi:hypothetical protein